MKNKKGFTLIEILAVIIIMGIMMIVAIPAISNYINDSRKSAYITTAKDYIKEVESKVVSKEYEFYDKDVTYYINIKNVPLESGGDSPFGDWVEAYVVVAYTPPETYHYYWVSLDSAGFKVDLTAREDLDESDIYNINSADPTGQSINYRAPIGTRNAVTIIDDEGNETHTTQYIVTTIEEADKCYQFSKNSTTKTASITYYDISCGTDLMIPSRMDDYEITSIASYAFYNMDITSVIIPSTVKTIGTRAFGGSETLTSVYFPEGLEKIEGEAFLNDSLTKVNFPSSLKSIGARAFKNNKLTKVSVDPSVTVGTCAFCGNPIPTAKFLYKINDDGSTDYSVVRGYLGDLTEFTDKTFVIPKETEGVQLTTIAKSAFYRVGLSGWKVIVPEGVTIIEDLAFYDSNISEVVLPSTLQSIGSGAFLSNNIKEINIPPSVTHLGTRAFTSNAATEKEHMWIYNRNSDGSINYSSLNSYAGSQTKNVSIPATAGPSNTPLLTIGQSCFYGEKRLTGKMKIPSTVTSIGKLAFANNKLTSVDNGDGVTTSAIVYQRKSDASIDYTTIISYGGYATTNVVIPDTVTTISENAFYRSYIKGVTIGANVTTIGAEAFQLCRLTQVTIPAKVETIGKNAFHKAITWTSSNGGLTKIINATKDASNKTRKFNWLSITSGKSGSKVATGTISNTYGDIEVTK